MAAKTKKDRLWSLCEKFVMEQRITCPEAICQCDRVIENAYDFIEKVCNIVGYAKPEDDDPDEEDDP